MPFFKMSKNSSSPGSPTNSLKKQKSKASEESPTSTAKSSATTIHENFVLLSTPDKFKDKPEGDTSVHKSRCIEGSVPEIKNLECLLLADTTTENAPQHLKNILELFDSLQLTQAELLFLLVYIVALESGVVAVQEHDKHESLISHIPPTTSFHSKNVLRLSRLQPSYSINEDRTCFSMKLCSIVNLENTHTDETTALLVGFVTGDLMIVTLSPANKTGGKGFSAALSIGRYVLSVQRKNSPLHHRFRKLDELSLVLRDKLFVPMRNQHLYWLDAGVYPTLQAMPPELYDNILQYLNVNQLKILANVSKSLHYLTRNNRRLLRD